MKYILSQSLLIAVISTEATNILIRQFYQQAEQKVIKRSFKFHFFAECGYLYIEFLESFSQKFQDKVSVSK